MNPGWFALALAPALGVASSRPLTLAEARALAEGGAPAVRLANGRVDLASASRAGAGLVMPVNPTVQADARASPNGEVGYGGGLNLTFDVGGAPAARVQEAEQRRFEATTDAAVTRLQARVDATAAYVEVALASMEVAHANEGIAIAERLLSAARARQEQGASSAVDVTSAEAELAVQKAQLQGALASEALDRLHLSELTGLGPEETVELATAIDRPPALPPLEVLERHLEQTPDLQLSAARLSLLASLDERLRKEARPKLGVYAGVDQAPASAPFGLLGLSVELPVAQRNQTGRARVAAEERGERDRAEVLRRHLRLAIEHHHQAAQAARAGLEALVSSGIPVASERLRLVEEGWKAGRFDVFKVTAAARDLLSTESSRVDLLRTVWRERLALERALGEAPDA